MPWRSLRWLPAAAAVAAGLLLAWLPLEQAALVAAGAALLLLVAIQPLVGLAATLLAGPLGAHESLLYGDRLLDSGQLLLLITLLSWLVRVALRGRLVIPRARLTLPLTLFVALAALSLFGAASWRLGLKELLKWLEIGAIMLMVLDLGREHWAAAGRSPRRAPWRWLVAMLLAAGLSQALLGLWQFSRGDGPEHFLVLGRFYRAYGTFYQPNPFGGYLALNAALALGALAGMLFYLARPWLSGRAPRLSGRLRSVGAADGLWLVFLAAAAAMCVAGLLVSWSRGAWLGFAAAAGVLALFWPRRIWVGALLLLLAVGLQSGAGRLGLLPGAVTERLASFMADFRLGDVRGVDIDDANYAVVERLAHWQAAVAMARNHPWLGVGFGNYEAAYADYRLMNWVHPLGHAHNYYLNVVAETGFIGAAGYLLFWGAVVWQALRLLGRLDWPRRGVALGLLAAWTYLSVHHLVDKLYVNNIYIHLGAMLGLQQLLDEES